MPYAAPGILTGTILSLARAFGETAPLLMVGAIAGTFSVVGQPVTVIFQARIELRPDGSNAAGTRHVHARVGATELMPGTVDVRQVRGTMYQWTLPRLPAGPAVLRLYWSDAAHQPIPGTESDSLSIIVR